MRITQFFTDVLRVKLRNPQWSWGAVDRATHRVFLRVWEDEIVTKKGSELVLVAWHNPSHSSPGFNERMAHLGLMQHGAETFAVVCTAVDPETDAARKIGSFDEKTVLRLGALTKSGSHTYAQVVARVPVEEVTCNRTGQSTVLEDLVFIDSQRIEETTKEALVSARVGQGRFRAQVLRLWGNRCAVTRSATYDVIRASHIKPWSHSTNAERLDPENGLPLVASLDALFDGGLISFDSSGRLIVSSHLSDSEQRIFGIGDGESLARKPTTKTANYLAFHRKNCFKG